MGNIIQKQYKKILIYSVTHIKINESYAFGTRSVCFVMSKYGFYMYFSKAINCNPSFFPVCNYYTDLRINCYYISFL